MSPLFSLFDKVEKCEFHVSSVQFLSFIVEQVHLSLDPAKIIAVVEWPLPTTLRQLQWFRFTIFHRHFVRDYSKVAGPLMALTSTL